MALKAVLFDMDGVIVDTEPLHRKAYFKMFEKYNIKVSQELYASYTGNSTKKVCDDLIERYNMAETRDELMETKRAYFKYFFDNDTEFDLIDGVLSLIQHYYDHRICLVLASSASMNTINWVFEKFDLEKYFTGKISGADLVESKPNPEIFIKAAKIANQPIENCMVIEDSTNGLLAAHNANIFCAAYKSYHSKLQDYTNANILIQDYKDLKLHKITPYFSV